MKWYWWVLIIVVILLIIYFVYKKQIANNLVTKSLNGQFGDILNDNLSCNSFDEIIYQQFPVQTANTPKIEIAKKGCGKYFKVTQVNCIVQPCNSILTEISLQEYNNIKIGNNSIQ